MAIIINIDTSLETATVSIAKDGIILLYLKNDVQKQHASFLHTAIQKLVTDLQISLNAINAIGCTIGPGSYTGLRVGLAAAKGFCYALNIPLITIGTLEAMAHSLQIHETNKKLCFCPMIDARRMEVYTALYDPHLKEILPAHAVVIDEHFCEQNLHKNEILFFGNGMEKYKNVAKSKNASFEHIADIYNSINMLSHKKFTEKNFTSLNSALPLYAKEFHTG